MVCKPDRAVKFVLGTDNREALGPIPSDGVPEALWKLESTTRCVQNVFILLGVRLEGGHDVQYNNNC